MLLRHCLCLAFIFASSLLFAQKQEVTVEVVVEKLQHADLKDKSTDAVYKFYHDSSVASDCISDRCFLVTSQKGAKTVDTSDAEIKTKGKLKPFKILSSGDSLVVKMETYENDKGEVCDFDKGDDYHYISTLNLKLRDLNPGVFSDTMTLYSEKNEFSAVVRVRYGLPKPADLAKETDEAVLDVSKPITLKSAIDSKNKHGLTYHWEYKQSGSNEWTPFSSATNVETLQISALKDIFKAPITRNEEVQVRMKAVSTELAGDYSSPITLNFTPPAPEFLSDVRVLPTCPNNDCGVINVKALKSVSDSIQFYLVKGKNLSGDQYPDAIKETDKLEPGIIAKDDSLYIESLKEGDYTLVAYNAVKSVGKAFTTYPVSIHKIKELKVASITPEDAGCDSTAMGQITVSMEGGNPDTLTYYISPTIGKPIIDHAGRKVVFTQLPPGTYSVIVRDKCKQDRTLDAIDINMKKEVTRLAADVAVAAQRKNNDANGMVKISVNGGSGSYTYNVSLGSLQSRGEIAGNTGSIGNLPKGTLNLVVSDNNRKCLKWDTTLVLRGDLKDALIPKDDKTVAVVTKDSSIDFDHIKKVPLDSLIEESPAPTADNRNVPETKTASLVNYAVVKDTIQPTSVKATPPARQTLSDSTAKSSTSKDSVDIKTTSMVAPITENKPAVVPATPPTAETNSGVELKPIFKDEADTTLEEVSDEFTARNDLLAFYNATERKARSVKGFIDETEKSSYTIVVEKSKYQMILLDEKDDTVRIYPVVFGNSDKGDKMMMGDKRTPEGEYRIESKRDHDEWDKILFINYPNAEDRALFDQRKKRGEIPADAKLGDGVAFHGTPADKAAFIDKKKDWTLGCVATKNKYIEEIFKHVGVGTKVIIRK